MVQFRQETSKENLNFILTGVTGRLGSIILYQILAKISDIGYKGNVVLFIRSKGGKPAKERLNDLLQPGSLPEALQKIDISRIKNNHIRLIDMDMKNIFDLNSFIYKNEERYHLIHCASYISFDETEYVKSEIKLTNYLGTLNLLRNLLPYLYKITYLSIGIQSGSESDVPSSYEFYRSRTEEEIRQICEGYGLEWEIKKEWLIANPKI